MNTNQTLYAQLLNAVAPHLTEKNSAATTVDLDKNVSATLDILDVLNNSGCTTPTPQELLEIKKHLYHKIRAEDYLSVMNKFIGQARDVKEQTLEDIQLDYVNRLMNLFARRNYSDEISDGFFLCLNKALSMMDNRIARPMTSLQKMTTAMSRDFLDAPKVLIEFPVHTLINTLSEWDIENPDQFDKLFGDQCFMSFDFKFTEFTEKSVADFVEVKFEFTRSTSRIKVESFLAASA